MVTDSENMPACSVPAKCVATTEIRKKKLPAAVWPMVLQM